jgi:hypothetical protein
MRSSDRIRSRARRAKMISAVLLLFSAACSTPATDDASSTQEIGETEGQPTALYDLSIGPQPIAFGAEWSTIELGVALESADYDFTVTWSRIDPSLGYYFEIDCGGVFARDGWPLAGTWTVWEPCSLVVRTQAQDPAQYFEGDLTIFARPRNPPGGTGETQEQCTGCWWEQHTGHPHAECLDGHEHEFCKNWTGSGCYINPTGNYHCL